MAAEGFEKLRIWQKAHQLTLEVYKETSNWPASEKFGLISQIRRAAVSVELLIAEGQSRFHFKETIHFCYESRASADEVRNCLMIARDLPEFSLNEDIFTFLNNEYIELIKGINSFIRVLNQKSAKHPRSAI